ncbi:MAG: ABC transporter ATP-binding protein [Alphaproteobacteria bacterium]|nr:ABC transporter ATP-binding protein [Alphaproteobacteria bacterium]
MTAPLLRIESLRASFRRRGVWHAAVSDLSFDIMPRETVALVGESGSGKSVTALSAMRLLPPRAARIEGRVALDGRDLLSLPEAEMRRVRGNEIAMIFQEPMTSLNPTLPIGDQIAEVFAWHRGLDDAAARHEALRMLDKVRLPAAAQRLGAFPHQLSGGMRQRVMIAIALACQPKLLIADEPTTALDVTIQAQILELIKALQEEAGMSVLFITHDMGVVAEVADRCVVMLAGKAVESGPTGRIFAEPRETYTRTLLSAVPRLGAMRGLDAPARFAAPDGTAGAGSPVASPPNAPDAAAAPLLSVRGLAARFDVGGGMFGRVTGRIHAVEDVSFDVHAGETLSLVGESGCGKSTVGRCILRLKEPAGGSIRLEGREIVGLPEASMRAERRKIQMIFQDPVASLDPRMRVGAAIAEPLTTHGLASGKDVATRVGELLRRVELDPDMADRLPHEFSGGQRQRICIARALAMAPRLIVADEAVSALDVSIKSQIIDLMLELQARLGLAFLFISHDMAVVERISHRVAVMFLGEIVEIGPRSAVFENPQHPYTRRLLAAIPVPDPARRGIRRALDNDEIRSPIRSLDYAPPARAYFEAAPGHLVQRWDEAAWGTGRAA